MDEPRRLLDVIGRIYAAPGRAEGWDAAIAAISELVGARASALLVVSRVDQSVEVGASCGFSEEDRARYQGLGGRSQDVRFQYLDKLAPGRVFREFEYVTDRAAWDGSPWIQHQRRNLGCYWCMSARVSTHGLWDDFVSTNRLERLGPHTDQEKADLQTLLPHLANAIHLHRTLTCLERRYGAVLSMLDHLLVGLVIVNEAGQVAVANQAARALCEGGGVMWMTERGYLRCRSADDDAELRRHLHGAIETALAAGESSGSQMVLRGHGQVVAAEVIPLRDDHLSDGDGLRGAAVFLLDPWRPTRYSMDFFRMLFGLTGAELAVAREVVNGASVETVAEARHTAPDTVRKQLKSVYAKVGVSSRLDLLRLAVKAAPPFRH